MLPNITIELRHSKDDTYESRIVSPQKEDILRCEFKFKEDDPFFVTGKGYLEADARRADKNVERGFIQRMGEHFCKLVTNGKNDFKNYLRHNHELKKGYCLTLALDYKIIKEKPQIKPSDDKEEIEELRERLTKSANLLWQIPWEYMHDGDGFLAVSGKARLTRKPIGLGEVKAIKSPQPLRLLVVVSSPKGSRNRTAGKAGLAADFRL